MKKKEGKGKYLLVIDDRECTIVVGRGVAEGTIDLWWNSALLLRLVIEFIISKGEIQ